MGYVATEAGDIVKIKKPGTCILGRWWISEGVVADICCSRVLTFPPFCFLHSSSEGTAGDVSIKHLSQRLLLQLAPSASDVHPYGLRSRCPVRCLLVSFSLYLQLHLSSLASRSSFCSPLAPSVMSCPLVFGGGFETHWAHLNQWSVRSDAVCWELIRPVWLWVLELKAV